VLGEAGVDQRLVRNVGRLLALWAQAARQALGGDQDHAGGDVERRDAHVAHARQRGGRVVGVQRGQHQVAGLRGLDGDVGGFQVADFADHDDVRILAQEGRSATAKVRPALSLTLTWLTPGRLISDGSSAVAMFTPGLLSRFRQV
jgi:hypothetical protein